MIPLGLSAADLAAFERGLVSSHSIRITVRLLDLDHRHVADLSGSLLGGQVNVDGLADVTRSASLELLDVAKAIRLDSGSPVAGAVFLDRMVQVLYGVWSESLPRWVDVPIFTGPITSLTRSGPALRIEAEGKEALARQAWRPTGVATGATEAALVRAVMALTGETRYSLPASSPRTSRKVIITGESDPWALAKASTTQQLYYDGRGVLVMRPLPTRSVFAFREGEGGAITSEPEISFSSDEIRNAVGVTGGVPKGAKTPVRARAYAPATHPFSPRSLGRANAPRYLIEEVEAPGILTVAAAQSLADQRLKAVLLQGIDASFEALVVPHLDPRDVIGVVTGDFSTTLRATRFSIPLNADGAMSVGHNARVASLRARAHRSWS